VRLWSLDPAYLDARGLVALWREGLLARAVLAGATAGYRRHPQLIRFRAAADPAAAIGAYLAAVADEAARRGYRFDRAKLGGTGAPAPGGLEVTTGQLEHERRHLAGKLAVRDPSRLAALSAAPLRPHPLFRVVDGPVADWEVVHR
jgi:hypothetical protein